MYNLTQFVLRFLISFLISFLLVVLFVHFYCPFTPANFMEKFLHFLRTYIYIFTILFHHSLDNDRSTVETSCFTVSFYRYNIVTYNIIYLINGYEFNLLININRASPPFQKIYIYI